MRMLFETFASDRDTSWWTEAACMALLVLLFVTPTMFHADPIASGMLLVGP